MIVRSPVRSSGEAAQMRTRTGARPGFDAVGALTATGGVLLPALVIHGLGNGTSFLAFNISAVGGVADEDQGLATALITAALQLGGGIGVGGGTPSLSACHWAFLVAALFSATGLIASLVGLGAPKAATAAAGLGKDRT